MLHHSLHYNWLVTIPKCKSFAFRVNSQLAYQQFPIRQTHTVATTSECGAKYIHSLVTNWTHFRFITQLILSHKFRNIPTLSKQFHSSHFLRLTRYYSNSLCKDIRFCCRGFTVIQFCLVYHKIVHSTLIKSQYWFFCVNVQKFLIFTNCWYCNQFSDLTIYCCTRRTVWTNRDSDIWN